MPVSPHRLQERVAYLVRRRRFIELEAATFVLDHYRRHPGGIFSRIGVEPEEASIIRRPFSSRHPIHFLFGGLKCLNLRFTLPVLRFSRLFCAITGKCLETVVTTYDHT
jgi:hypothetical protein